MKKTLLAVFLGIVFSAAGFCGEQSACGNAKEISGLFYGTLFAGGQQNGSANLITALFPTVKCLTKLGYLGESSGRLKGRYGVVLEVLSVLRNKPLRLATAQEIDNQARLMKMRQQQAGL